MNAKPKIFAIIPARGGSKGIPGKNVRLLNGKPLICYTIEAALKSDYLDMVFVSTDDTDITKKSENCGAKVIRRPAELASDESPVIDAVFHAVETIKNDFTPDIIVLLQPTSPLRNAGDIDAAVELFINNECDSVISMCKAEHSPYWYFKFDGGDFKPVFGYEYLKMRRQDISGMYRPNGAIYITAPGNLYKNKSFYGGRILPYIMPPERSIDIDEEIDFMLAELLLKRMKG